MRGRWVLIGLLSLLLVFVLGLASVLALGTDRSVPVTLAAFLPIMGEATPNEGQDPQLIHDTPPLTVVYANSLFGYRFEYPVVWYALFDGAPRRVVLSTLDPASHTRDEMREQGCLIEIAELERPAGMSLTEVRAQMPRAFHGAEPYDLAGAAGLRVLRTGEEQGFDSDWIFVEHGGYILFISAEYGGEACEIGLLAWERLLGTWAWIENAG